MSGSIVYLFADTNLLIQCRPLEELDWSAWNTFKEVRLIVSSPVLREIDYRKNRGNDRIGKRARAASAMFREILNDKYKLVRDSDPRVQLSVEPQHQPSKALEGRLDYQERDDQLIGTIYEFAERYPGNEVRLLTHDTTPMYTAKSLGIAADVIPDEWLLPPENTRAEKEFTALKEENARLKKAEPSFAIRCLNSDETEIECYEFSYTWFEPLTDDQIDGLMQRLKDRFPLETDFGSREQTEREPKASVFRIPGTKEEFVPATDEDIAKYRDEHYPQWLEQCENTIRNYHRTLRQETPLPAFAFLVENRGTRPAVDSLITIEARGNFKITPPARNDQDEEDNEDDEGQRADLAAYLPRPLIAPRGRWRTTIGGNSQSTFSALDTLYRSIHGFSNMADPSRDLLGFDRSTLNVPILQPTPHDPNAFYYKPHRPQMPQDAFSLKCDQWRHEDGEISFHGKFHLPTNQGVVSGALVCRIQAGNLSKTASKLIPVRLSISHASAFDRANELMNALIERSELQVKQVS